VPTSLEVSSQRIIISQTIFLPVFFLDLKEEGPVIRHTVKTTDTMPHSTRLETLTLVGCVKRRTCDSNIFLPIQRSLPLFSPGYVAVTPDVWVLVLLNSGGID
jgi:hypothetical protein